MISKKILIIQVGLLALTLSPCGAAPTTNKTKITKLKLSLNDVADTRADTRAVRGDGPAKLSEAELLKIAEMKSKFADSMAPKITELNSLHRQMKLSMAKPTIDRAQVMQLQSRINAIHADLANSKLTFDLDMSDGMPAEAKERMRKHLLFDAAFGPEGFGGPPPPGFGPPPTCAPQPGFGIHPPQFGPPPMMGFPPGLRPEGMLGPMPGRGPRGAAPPAPPAARSAPEPREEAHLAT